MKGLIFGLVGAVALIAIIITASGGNKSSEDYIRIHIRANSNLQVDQSVKYKVKDEVVEYLSRYVSECKTKAEAYEVVKAKEAELSNIATNVLRREGFDYSARAKLRREEFPVRTYNDVTLDEGVYDALIIELGEGAGDNWWCVLFPPLCFVSGEDTGEHNVTYKSKILEVIGYYGGK